MKNDIKEMPLNILDGAKFHHIILLCSHLLPVAEILDVPVTPLGISKYRLTF